MADVIPKPKTETGADFLKMWTSLKDPDARARARALAERKARQEAQRADTGL